MTQLRDTDGPPRGVIAGLTVALYAAALTLAYLWHRFYGRWSKENHLFSAPRARVDRFKTGYRSKKTNALEVGGDAKSNLPAMAAAFERSHPR